MNEVKTNREWWKVFVARFGRPYEFDPDMWERVLGEDLGREWSDDEVCATLKWMKSEGQVWKKVETASVLVMAVRTYRKFLRTPPSEKESEKEDCRLCNGTGMIPYWPEWKSEWKGEQYFMGERQDHVPCLCKEGKRKLASPEYQELRPEEMDALRRRGGMAVEQIEAWNRVCEESEESA